MPIKICSYRAVNYTLLKAIERINGHEIMIALETVYNDEVLRSHNMLWDLGEAHVIDMTQKEYIHIITFLKTLMQKNLGGRTAIYVPGRIGYSIANQQIKLAKDLPVKLKAFRYYHEAAVWLTWPNRMIVISAN